jgi:hypothetical protein
MYKLSVGALFKNEATILKEWIDHYLYHGVEHFYLINDNSTDNFLDVLRPYIDKSQVTLFTTKWDYYTGRQRDMYNSFILPRIKETKWLLMVDIDEYLWSPKDINLNTVLDICGHFSQIQIRDVLFGSNGHIEQPPSVVKGFTMRQIYPRSHLKYIINCDFSFASLNVHHASAVDAKHMEPSYFVILDHEYFILNHYSCLSRQYWLENKCVRGDSDNYRIRTLDDFNKLDVNEIEDLRLCEQNYVIESANK